jgi:hypothetical protein
MEQEAMSAVDGVPHGKKDPQWRPFYPLGLTMVLAH